MMTSEDLLLVIFALVRKYGMDGYLNIENFKETYDFVQANGGIARLVMAPFDDGETMGLCVLWTREDVDEWRRMGLLGSTKVGTA